MAGHPEPRAVSVWTARVRPVCLPPLDQVGGYQQLGQPGARAVLAGLGLTRGNNLPTALQRANLTLLHSGQQP